MVAVPANPVELGFTTGYGSVQCAPRPVQVRLLATARVNQPPSLRAVSGVCPVASRGVTTLTLASVHLQRFVTFPPFYRAYKYIPPVDMGKVIRGYTGGDQLNNLRFVGRSGL